MRSQIEGQVKVRNDRLFRAAATAILQQARSRRTLLHNAAFALCFLASSGCGSAPTVAASPAAVPEVVTTAATPTEFLWFPATATPAPAVRITREPTPERKPGVGEWVVRDEMTSSAHWNAASTGSAAATVSEKGLTISAQPGDPGVVSLHRSAVFDDMYLEVTARTNLCRDRDAYGIVVRAPNDVAHYRFLCVCDGTAAAARFSLGGPRVLQPPSASADVPLGAPGEVRLGVWALGNEFRFFLNDRYQFTVSDSNYPTGGVGVFVQAGGQTPAVVTFSDLAIYRLSADAAVGTAVP